MGDRNRPVVIASLGARKIARSNGGHTSLSRAGKVGTQQSAPDERQQ